MVVVTPTAAGVRFPIRVMPRARKAEVKGVRDGRILVRVTPPPLDGAANQAVVSAIAVALSVPARHVRIASGEKSRNKIVEVTGLAAADVTARLATLTVAT